MIESKYSPSNKLVFRETFTDETSVRANGGVPTAVTFANGVASCVAASSSKIVYPKNLSGTYSVRVRFTSFTPIISTFLCDFRNTEGNGSGYIQIGNPAITVAVPNGTPYVDGVATSTISSNIKEIVITGMTISSVETFINCRYSSTTFMTASYELLEIYEGTLTASEVKNLYDNDSNKTIDNGTILGPELITAEANRTFSSDTGFWLKNGDAQITDGVARFTGRGDLAASGSHRCISMSNPLLIGTNKLRRLLFSYRRISGTGNIQAGFGFNDITTYTTTTDWQIGVLISSISKHTGDGQFALGFGSTSLTSVFEIDNVSVQEIVRTPTLNFDPRNGALEDKTGLRTLTPTAVDIVRDGQSYAARFNGTTSLINTGSDFIGTKPVTICGWVKNNTYGASNAGRLLDNARLYYWVSISSNVKLTSDAGTEVSSVSNSILLNKYYFIATTRKADGKVTFYIGDQRTAPALSGTADQNSGTPVAGTTNVIIGNRSDGIRTLNGNIKLLQVYDGILDLETITNIWSSTLNSI